MFDLLFAGLHWPSLLVAYGLCLAISALGFLRVDWFISIGYGASIAALALVFSIINRTALEPWVLAQQLLLFAYGVRLAGFLVMRERSPSFARELAASKERSVNIVGGAKFAIWVSVSLLYVGMYAPGLLTLTSGAGASLWLIAGVVVMVSGLGLEAAADAQKSRLKAAQPSRFASSGLFAMVRSPNYLGEMLFWLGAFISGIAAYGSVSAWILAGAGLVCIELVMLGSARRLEQKQLERYGTDAAYQAYASRVPILFPLLPLYSLKNLKVYLG